MVSRNPVKVLISRVTVLVENVEDGREYTVEETHNSEAEISQISVQDPLRYFLPHTKSFLTKVQTDAIVVFHPILKRLSPTWF